MVPDDGECKSRKGARSCEVATLNIFLVRAEWLDSSALTDDMIKSSWDKKSPARKVCVYAWQRNSDAKELVA